MTDKKNILGKHVPTINREMIELDLFYLAKDEGGILVATKNPEEEAKKGLGSKDFKEIWLNDNIDDYEIKQVKVKLKLPKRVAQNKGLVE